MSGGSSSPNYRRKSDYVNRLTLVFENSFPSSSSWGLTWLNSLSTCKVTPDDQIPLSVD